MPTKKDSVKPESINKADDNKIVIGGDVIGNDIIIGDNNVVKKTTIIQKFFNIFKSDSETLEQRNRRILLGHVENAWIKGVLDASLHGAALLDLGIKPDPEAVTKYPWAIKKESTDETLPAGTSMLEIFDSIGMGRSLLILGVPGSGKTTMLLELARQLIQHAREDVTQPIPMVFNLASWSEKLTLADWLAQELNNLYSVPRKTAPDWVKGNKLLLLLGGLDEVRQESRAKCMEAINEFRKQNGMTSLAVCSRSQDYADLNAKLSFEGAIEVQPLTQGQIAEFFNRFGDEMAGITQALEKDSSLREMAETPLFLSIMIMAYRGKKGIEILISGDEKVKRKQLFDTYIECMFDRSQPKRALHRNQEVKKWLYWLARRMIEQNNVPLIFEHMQFDWLESKILLQYKVLDGFFRAFLLGFLGLLIANSIGMLIGFFTGLLFGLLSTPSEIKMVDTVNFNWKKILIGFVKGISWILVLGVFSGSYMIIAKNTSAEFVFSYYLTMLIVLGPFIGIISALINGINVAQTQTLFPGQKILFSTKNSFLVFIVSGIFSGITIIAFSLFSQNTNYMIILLRGGITALIVGSIFWSMFGGNAVLLHYVLRFFITLNNFLPWRLIPFLDHCVDLIFLRRVGGGYIFVHRLLMEHFAEMYMENPTSKGN